jgi:primosomal protein N' (replication factor Y)
MNAEHAVDLTQPKPAVVQVAVGVPLRKLFSYRVPVDVAGRIDLGSRVAVPFGKRKLVGVVAQLGTTDDTDIETLKELGGLVEPEPIFHPELFRFLAEAADYYMHPLGEVFRAAAPVLPRASLRALKQSGFLTRVQEIKGARVSTPLASADSPQGTNEPDERDTSSHDTPPELNAAQRRAVDRITAAVSDRTARSFVLHGVTGSGKTEVYMRVIADALRAGRGALVLVPEIALTPQLVGVFQRRFGDQVAVLHSALHDRERYESWHALLSGRARIALGARSALFAPVRDLAVVIVDEEHDPSFKQEEGFRYHGRDMALLRAKLAGAACVLGSATPSVESYFRARQGKHELLELPERATSHPLPSIQVVDLRVHRTGPSQHPLLTAPMHRAIERCIAQHEQGILFLNRRGFAPSVQCTDCGEIVQCPACSVTLTEHRHAGVLRCHYCDYTQPTGTPCTHCNSTNQETLGMGTERLQEALTETFAGVRVARLDRDTAQKDGGEEVLQRFRAKEIDLLVGTQMVTKGHDIPGVTFVGVMLADQSMGFPDFRAIERTFQLLSQVAGRAGRGSRPGEVIIQTYQPEHPVVQTAKAHDYARFFQMEAQHRAELRYPPSGHLIAFRIDGPDDAATAAYAQHIATLARHATQTLRMPQNTPQSSELDQPLRVLGPAPAPIARLRARYRYRVLLAGLHRPAVRRVAQAVLRQLDARSAHPKGPIRVAIDIDPVSML